MFLGIPAANRELCVGDSSEGIDTRTCKDAWDKCIADLDTSRLTDRLPFPNREDYANCTCV